MNKKASPQEMSSKKTLSELADELEHKMTQELDKIAVKSVIYTSGERDPTLPPEMISAFYNKKPGQYFLMSHDPRLRRMPPKPTLFDFFQYRFAPASHLLQSAALAQKNGYDEKVILACLLHDISMIGFIQGDHGHWGAELVAPYVSEEVSLAIRAHQTLRFFPDESVGYAYPETYLQLLGPDYKVEPHIEEEYKRIRNHKWYMIARLITVNDIYSFDPNAVVNLQEFTDIIGRNFRQPEEGLGFDNSPSAHIWRTINWPTRVL